jgi:acyl carrier protein
VYAGDDAGPSGAQREMSETISREVKEFVVGNFLFGQGGADLTDEQSFLESGIIDSTGVLELVAFLEQHYGITVGDRELLPENLDSVRNASAFVARKLAAKDTPVAD